MAELQGETGSGQVGAHHDGHGAPPGKGQASYCATCGVDANVRGLALERFGEVFCSEGHAEEFVAKVREARVQAAAAPALQTSTAEIAPTDAPAGAAPKQRDWKRYLTIGTCCAVPLLALVVLVGGGGVLLGAAGAVLPLLAAVACPLAMYFMMRGTMKMGQHDNPKDKGEEK